MPFSPIPNKSCLYGQNYILVLLDKRSQLIDMFQSDIKRCIRFSIGKILCRTDPRIPNIEESDNKLQTFGSGIIKCFLDDIQTFAGSDRLKRYKLIIRNCYPFAVTGVTVFFHMEIYPDYRVIRILLT